MDPTVRPMVITVGSEKLRLLFDLNTFVAFEDVTGKMFLGWLENIQAAARAADQERVKRLREVNKDVKDIQAELSEDPEHMLSEQFSEDAEARTQALRDAVNAAGSVLMRSVSMKDFRALVWAANHVYRRDEPVWPLTIGQIGSLITIQNFGELLPVVLRGSINSLPTGKKTDSTSEEEEDPNARPFVSPPKKGNDVNGGKISGVSDEDILASLDRS